MMGRFFNWLIVPSVHCLIEQKIIESITHYPHPIIPLPIWERDVTDAVGDRSMTRLVEETVNKRELKL